MSACGFERKYSEDSRTVSAPEFNSYNNRF